ncbi:Fic family protein [Luteibacter aegosomaticola]|uniref:Fic family protein n=1 Tax=Luteibacter aegosomaticola TaxID=2911538 RepID=UPI001FF9F95E|nr:Fic family protein [Luteibacter aegosomaticola]UPG88516.1 Fic family protein [Luteibacter aegosomaticola]
MRSGEYTYIWQRDDWPTWRYDQARLAGPLAEVSLAQGRLLGRLADVGMALRSEASLAALTDDVVKSSAIEGEHLDVASVRSSIARHLGVEIGALAPVDRHVEGVVDMILDATLHSDETLTTARLHAWHTALFPTGYSHLTRVRVGAWRDDAKGPMQVVSGPMHRHTVHFEAPPADSLEQEMQRFLAWANARTSEPPVIKAALAHLWFVTLHPFDDGNGRMTRAVGDLFLARADGSPQRFYSLSAEIQRHRSAYYDVLERTQKGSLEVDEWLAWFLMTLHGALAAAQATLDRVLYKARFWRHWGSFPMNARQTKLVNRLLNGFEGKLTSGKWATIAKSSTDTALRDITELVTLGMLRRTEGGGRSTGYELAPIDQDGG